VATSAGQPQPGPPGSGWSRTLATSFDIKAAEYARLRPDYPIGAITAAIPDTARTVLDLAAGTGKLTGPLLALGREVIAVEPLPGMLAELRHAFPDARAVAGVAEHIPLRSAVVDAVVVGQAFHWFDADPALDEIARVLRPAGTLSLISTHDDERDAFVQDFQCALTRIGRPVGGITGRGGTPAGPAATGDKTFRQGAIGSGRPPFDPHPSFTPPELTEFSWRRTQSLSELIGLLHTYSYVIRASAQARAELDQDVRDIAARHFPGRTDVTIPVVCQLWRSTCR
jgi:SAM-dependent methyltransferase